jgi:hypothetical protein
MRAPARLAAFAAALAVVGGGAALVGAAVEPVHDATTSAHAEDGHGAETTGAIHGDAGASGMDAPSGLAVSADGYTFRPASQRLPRATDAEYRFQILGADGEPVREFEEEQRRRMHLIVVRRDMVLYRHLHPRMDAEGTWRVRLRLPQAGVYRAYADFQVEGERHTLAGDIMVAGPFAPQELPAPERLGSVEGYDVSLAAPALRAGTRATLSYQARVPGARVRLQPYLGANGHLVALREGDLAYLHVHPTAAPAGPDRVAFEATFPTAGRYRLFLQTKYDGRTRTVAHTVEVTR